MTSSAPRSDRHLSAPEFVARARARLTLDAPEGLTDPDLMPRHDDTTYPAVMAAIAAATPTRTAAVLVPIIARGELTVLFTERTADLGDDSGQFPFRVARSTPLIRARQRPRCVKPRRRSRSTVASSSRSVI